MIQAVTRIAHGVSLKDLAPPAHSSAARPVLAARVTQLSAQRRCCFVNTASLFALVVLLEQLIKPARRKSAEPSSFCLLEPLNSTYPGRWLQCDSEAKQELG